MKIDDFHCKGCYGWFDVSKKGSKKGYCMTCKPLANVAMPSTKRLHALRIAGRDIDGEGYSASLCGLHSESAVEWEAAQTEAEVTCRRCLVALPRMKDKISGWPFA